MKLACVVELTPGEVGNIEKMDRTVMIATPGGRPQLKAGAQPERAPVGDSG